eukprot:314478_1
MVVPVDDDTFVIIIWTSLSLGTFILLILLIFSIKNQFCIKNKYETNISQHTICHVPVSKLLKYLQLFQVLGYVLCNISWILYWHFLLNTPNLDSEKRMEYKNFLHVLAIIFWAISTLSFFMLLILRLWSVFLGTEYQLPNYAFIIWTVLLTLILAGYILFIVDVYEEKIDDDLFNDIVFPGLMILNIVTGASLLYAFGSKLFALAMKMSIHDINEYSSRMSHKSMTAMTDKSDPSYQWVEYETSLDSKQINLLKVISKNTLLGGIAILIIQVYFGFQYVELYKKNHYGWDIWSYYLCTRYILRTVSMCIEIFCVYLSFAVNRKLFKLLCGKCQNRLQLCCQWKMKRKINNTSSTYELSLLGKN